MKILSSFLLGLIAVFHFQASAVPLLIVRPSAPGSGYTEGQAISSDGNFVAFASDSSNLVANDNNNFSDIFVYSVVTQTIERISTDTAGNEATSVHGDGNSYNPSISADGRYVVFQSRADNLVPGDTNGALSAADGEDIFIVDRQAALNTANRIRRVSVRPGGTETNKASGYPSISGDGRYVAFESNDTGLVAGTSGANLFIYIVDTTQIGTVAGITGVPVPTSPSPANKECYNAKISADAHYVAFEFYVDSSAPVFTYSDVYAYDRIAATLKVITGQATTGAEGMARDGRYCQNPAISSDGHYVAFNSNTGYTSGGGLAAFHNVFVADRTAVPVTFRLASADSAGTQGNADALAPAVSADGNLVAFYSAATNFLNGGTNAFSDIYRKDLTTNALALVAITEGNDASFNAAMSADGKRVSFLSNATNLVAGDVDNNFSTDVFLAILPSSVADLASLTTTAGTLTPPTFDKNVLTYTASVSNATTSVTVTPTVADATATIQVRINNGAFAPVTSGNASAALNLNAGMNPIDIQVTAQDGTMKTYSITVTQTGAGSNADLASLTTTADKDPLFPLFDKNTTSYTASVLPDTMMTTVTPTTADPLATVKVNNVTVTSGSPSGPLMLMFSPDNAVNVEVTAQDGTTKKTYTVTVARGRYGTANSDLAALTLTVGGTPVAFNHAFDPAMVSYTAGVPGGSTTVKVTATAADGHATLTINGTAATSGSSVDIALPFEATPIRVAVTPADVAAPRKIYTLFVLKLKAGQTTPTGNYVFGPPPGLSTQGQAMIDASGNYVGFVSVKLNPGRPTPDCPPFTTSTAVDAAGKLLAMAAVDTFTRTPARRPLRQTSAAVRAAAPLDNLVHITGAVKTINGIPMVTAKSSTKNSTLEGSQFVGTGTVVIPASLTAVQGGNEVQGVMASGSVKVDGVTNKSKPTPVTWPIDPLNTADIRADWNVALTITENTDAKGKKSIVASALLNLPNGDTTQFKQKKVTYSAKNGYSISFSGGVKLDDTGAQVVNPLNGKPVLDKKSKVMISKMLLTLNGTTNLWQPTTGLLKCQFLGQKQTYPLVSQLLNP